MLDHAPPSAVLVASVSKSDVREGDGTPRVMVRFSCFCSFLFFLLQVCLILAACSIALLHWLL